VKNFSVNGLPVPELLSALSRDGQWVHPGDARLREVIPFLVDPVVFLSTPEEMSRESSGRLADDSRLSPVYHMARGSRATEPIELPWLDVERSFLIAVNRWPGDDTAIALDYRTDVLDPRVVAGDWESGRGCVWREVSPTFSTFVRLLGAGGPDSLLEPSDNSASRICAGNPWISASKPFGGAHVTRTPE
jgi:hypothetical protein